LGGAVPAESGAFRELSVLFAQYGVEAFLESTNAFVAVLNNEGQLISWNSSFGQLKQNSPVENMITDFLSSPSKLLFDEFLKNTRWDRQRKQMNLEFAWNDHGGDFSCIFVPLPDEQTLFIAEPVLDINDLQTMTSELQKIKHSLAIKETELKAVIAQADEISHTDALTLIPNRKRIIADLQQEVIFAGRYGTPLAISLIDIDFFKNINDQYGHVVGDEVLRKLAMELRDRIRHPDSIGRYGGEEFLIVLPHSTSRAATEQAERLCRHARSLVIRSAESEITLTISVGIAQYKIHQEDWQEFLSRADGALYQAKNSGRNRWVVSEA
jgi:diguanylate cyclase (GGDEF)-like protein